MTLDSIAIFFLLFILEKNGEGKKILNRTMEEKGVTQWWDTCREPL